MRALLVAAVLLGLSRPAIAQDNEPFDDGRPRVRLSHNQHEGIRIGAGVGLLAGTASGYWLWSRLDRDNCGMGCIAVLMSLPAYILGGAAVGGLTGGVVGFTIGTIAGSDGASHCLTVGLSARIRW